MSHTAPQATNVNRDTECTAKPKILKGIQQVHTKQEKKKKRERQRRACTEACSKHPTHNFSLRKTVNYNLIVSASCTYWGEKHCRQGPLPSLEVPVSGRHARWEKYCTTVLLKAPPNNTHTHAQSQNIKLIHWISTSVEGKKMLDTSFYKHP